MPKLQQIKRSNGSLTHSVNIPLETIEELGWNKGEDLTLEIQKVRDKKIVIIFREDELNEQEENNDG